MGTENAGLHQTPPILIALFGPTAVGKSALALAMALEFGGEIVTADSRQVYRYMDIGTDKPSAEDRALVPHHMVDLVDPDDPFTLAMYQDQAFRAIHDVVARGRLPILAGGTPLYVNAIVEGWQIPRVEPDPVLRDELEELAARLGPAALHARLAEQDPLAASGILPTNTRRVIRALEVIEHTGRPMSEQQSKQPPPFRLLKIGLTCDRAELLRRTDVRVDLQLERGLLAEVARLHEMGYSFELPSMSGLGYRQTGDYLMGRATLSETVQRIKWDTHAFTRHQGNWFRRQRDACWLDTTGGLPLKEAADLIARFLPARNGEISAPAPDRVV